MSTPEDEIKKTISTVGEVGRRYRDLRNRNVFLILYSSRRHWTWRQRNQVVVSRGLHFKMSFHFYTRKNGWYRICLQLRVLLVVELKRLQKNVSLMCRNLNCSQPMSINRLKRINGSSLLEMFVVSCPNSILLNNQLLKNQEFDLSSIHLLVVTN